jgi:enoyl-CoA hydratase
MAPNVNRKEVDKLIRNFKNIIYEKKEGIATIKFNRPRYMNALTKEMMLEIDEALTDARNDDNVKVLVITGVGRAFCAGEDLKEGLVEVSPLEFRDKILRYQKFTKDVKNMKKVVIAAVNGYALGGGCEMALSCDMVVASENAKFGFPEVKVGLLMTNAGFHWLPRLVGEKKAKELALIGDMIDAREAERIGLINKVVPAEKLHDTVLEMAKKIMDNAPISVALTKFLIDKGIDSNLDSVMALETEGVTVTYVTEDRKEGALAFTEKRKPKYQGK